MPHQPPAWHGRGAAGASKVCCVTRANLPRSGRRPSSAKREISRMVSPVWAVRNGRYYVAVAATGRQGAPGQCGRSSFSLVFALDGCAQMSQLSRRYHGSCRLTAITRTSGGWMTQESYEEQQEDLDPHRREERDAAVLEIAGRIRQKGVLLTGRESSSQLDDLMTAIDRFEAAVVTRGGRSEEHTSELQSQSKLVCRLLPQKKQPT